MHTILVTAAALSVLNAVSAYAVDGILARSEVHVRAPDSSKNVIIEMFEWTWESVATECTQFIGPAGYGYVQVSPPQEHIQGTQWWTDYQPVSYTLTSKRGDRSQFADMITTCHDAGVKVIADTIWNHMTGDSSGTGVAGTSFTMYDYPPTWDSDNFHYCDEPDHDLQSWDDITQVWTCQLDGLADLATETDDVRSGLAAYGNDLLSLGIDGLRLDSAKSINVSDIANILSRLNGKPYVTQEVVWGEGQPVTPNMYTGNGDVQEFRYPSTLETAFLGGGISSLESFDNLGWVPSDQANIFVVNHDLERNGGALNYQAPDNTYTNAMIFSLAHPYGTPTILSSYTFSTADTDAGAPNGGAGTCYGAGGTNGWLCQHRWTGVAGMVGFHNNVGDVSLINWVSPQSEQIAFERDSLGFLAINNADSAWTTTFKTSLPDGSYCDVISGANSGGSCTGTGFTVSGGSFQATVPQRGAVAIHTGGGSAGGSGSGSGSSGTVTVNFAETATTTFGENIFVVGSIPALGNWNTDDAISLSSADYPVWTLSFPLPANTDFQYKFIRKETDGSIVWESDPNREDTTPASGSQTITTTWR